MQITLALWLAITAIPLAFVLTFPAWGFGKLAAFARRRHNREAINRNAVTSTSLNRWTGFLLASVAAAMLTTTLISTLDFAFAFAIIPAAAVANYFAFMIAALSGTDATALTAQNLDRPAPGRRLDDIDLAMMTLVAESESK